MFRKNWFTCFAALLMFVITFSCSNLSPSTSTNIPTSEGTTLATQYAANGSTATPPVAETLPETSSPVPQLSVTTQCVGSNSKLQKLELKGVLAMGNAIKALGANFGFFLYDLSNKKIIKMIPEGLSNQVSPDNKYIAYTHHDASDTTLLVGVLDSTGQLISDVPLSLDGQVQDYYNWQNALQLRTVSIANEDKVAVYLFNPFSNEHSSLKTDWSGVYKPNNPFKDKLVQWKFDEKATGAFFVYGANILYDPALARVVYPKEDGLVSLVNVKTEQELARAHFVNWGRLPIWSPNGEYLTILNREGNADEFYLVSRNGGEFQQITNFSAEFGHALVADYTWSPDSKRIAFWLNLETEALKDGAQSELAILDIPSGQVTRLCVQGISTNAYEPWTMNHPEPVWSPDGRYIVITQWDDPVAPKKYNVAVIDTQHGTVENIAENTAPIGWMINEP